MYKGCGFQTSRREYDTVDYYNVGGEERNSNSAKDMSPNYESESAEVHASILFIEVLSTGILW